jgi:hypothetical protein
VTSADFGLSSTEQQAHRYGHHKPLQLHMDERDGRELRAHGVARNNKGATTVSSTSDITVKPPNLLSTAVFFPSSNHATAVDRYVLEFFPAEADPTVANPVATLDIGKPAITNGECKADISSVLAAAREVRPDRDCHGQPWKRRVHLQRRSREPTSVGFIEQSS